MKVFRGAGALWHNRLIARLTLGGHMDEEIKLKFAEMQAVIDALKAGVKRRPCHERAGEICVLKHDPARTMSNRHGFRNLQFIVSIIEIELPFSFETSGRERQGSGRHA